MPVIRIVMIRLDMLSQRLDYALRVAAPEGTEPLTQSYRSSYGDSADPDARAIRAGTVLEQLGTVTIRPLRIDADALPPRDDNETKAEALARVQAELEVKWVELQSATNESFAPQDLHWLSWDGTEWAEYEDPKKVKKPKRGTG